MIPLRSLVNDTRSRVEFMPGNENTVPDILSRYRTPELCCVEANKDGKEPYLEHVAKRQNKDEEC